MNDQSLLDLLVESSRVTEKKSTESLTAEAVLGNIFIFMFAGHEASANTIHFIMVLLACDRITQAALQRDVDLATQGLPEEQWSYDGHFQVLMDGLVGAVINEALRLFTVLPFILKATTNTPQPLVLNGRTHVVPAQTLILINTSAAHRNPRFWKEPSSGTLDAKPHPLERFDPQQWLDSGDQKEEEGRKKIVPGSFIPFSGGPRGCLGEHFSMVELCAVVARIFAKYTVELVVPDLDRTSSEASKENAWQKARDRANHALTAGVTFEMSLRLVADVPVKFVARLDQPASH
ncbi:MAG: hypothetical protein Q9202_001903 [Teloschistes flavicans]